MGSYVGSWANAIEISLHSVEKFYMPVIWVKTAATNRAHGGKRSHILPLKPVIRAAQNFRWWIWDDGNRLTSKSIAVNK
jgi:hypothetical protein